MTHLPSPAGWSGDVAQLTPDQIVDMVLALSADLPAAKHVQIIRALNENLSFSYGSDRIDQGCDRVDDDLRDEERAAFDPYHYEPLPLVTTRAVSLNPDAWRA